MRNNSFDPAIRLTVLIVAGVLASDGAAGESAAPQHRAGHGVERTTSDEQRASANTPCAPQWLPTIGGHPGTSGPVRAFAHYDDGEGPALYVAGAFGHAGGVDLGGIGRWDGSTWWPLPLEMGYFGIRVMQVYDDGSGPQLYVGGSDPLQRWNGMTWSAVGNATGNTVHAMGVFDDGEGAALYVGGDNAYLSRYDSRGWVDLDGLDGESIRTVTVHDDGRGAALYVGGDFDIDSVGALDVARWDGAAWQALGSGTNGEILALASFDDGSGSGPALYAAGDFTEIDGVAANRIARWDGTAWSQVGAGANNRISALVVHDDGGGPALYAGGRLTGAGGVSVNRIARWDGTAWSPLETGMSDEVLALASLDDGNGPALLAGGGFRTAGDVVVLNVARWDGSAWSSFDDGLDNVVRALTVFDDGSGTALYLGGDFQSVHGVEAKHGARWDGTEWSPLGSGLSHTVRALAVFDDGRGPALYATGAFASAGGVTAYRVARWDGTNWSPLGTGLNAEGRTLAVHDDGTGRALYVGGTFTMAGGIPAGHIARWDGSTWSALAAGVDGTVFALAEYDDGTGPALYAGGSFSTAGGVSASLIARWNRSTWSSLGSGPSGWTVYSLAVHDNGAGSGPALYVGGDFSTVAGAPSNGLAQWDGRTWIDASGDWNNDEVFSLHEHDDGSGTALYAGLVSSGVVRRDDTVWTELGDFPFAVPVFATYDDGSTSSPALCVGGWFVASPAGDSYLTRWGCDVPPCPDPNGDRNVDVNDLVAIVLAWGSDDELTDVTGDGIVDVLDLVEVILHWGPCP